MFWAEADGAGPSGNVLAFVASQLGVVGALVWYLWYQSSREMPAARRDYLAALNDQRTSHGRERAADRAEIHELRENVHQLVMAQQDLADAIREAVDVRRMPRPSRPGALTPGSSMAPTPHTPAEP